jgi:transposase
MVVLQMKRVIDTSEVLGTVEAPEGVCELCASADSSFDEEAGRLVTKLEAFLRPTDLLVKERRFRADWLPENEMVTESVAREECHEVARDIFNRWVRKVREAAPKLHRV